MLALLLMAGIANAQEARKAPVKKDFSSSCIDLGKAKANGLANKNSRTKVAHENLAVEPNRDQQITEVRVNGYESPMTGWNSQEHMSFTIPAGVNYSILSYGWWDDDEDQEFYGTFVLGTNYSAGITLSANSGYYFAENCTFYLNNQQTFVDNMWSYVDEEDNTIAYIWSLPVPAATDGIIDFETGNFSQYPFDNSGSEYPWVVADVQNGCDNGSQYCIKSSNAAVSNSSSTIEATYNYTSDGFVNFDAKCMGETSWNGTVYDKCSFYIDDVEQFAYGAISSWNNYIFEVTAGSHIFKWAYTKDNSVNPTGDYFAIDNIFFGLGDPCIAPTSLNATCDFTNAALTWNGYSESFTLRYRILNATSSWTTITGITTSTYTLSDLESGTTYEVEIISDCDSQSPLTQTFTTMAHHEIQSTCKFYGYASYSLDGADWVSNYISFTMQNPTTVEVESAEIPSTHAASYALGYLWFITDEDGILGKALIDDEGNIGTPDTVATTGFVGFGTAISMSYNNADGKMYYIESDEGTHYLKYFDPMNATEGPTTVGAINEGANLFAINAEGEAYCISKVSGNLYRVNLDDASTVLVGNTGVSFNYVQSMAFDMETGELFWAQILSATTSGLYYVNTETGQAIPIGKVGGELGSEITGLFMVWGDVPVCEAPTTIDASNITETSALVTWDGEADNYILRYRVHTPNAQGHTYDFEGQDEISGMQGWTTIDSDGDENDWMWLAYGINFSYENAQHSGIAHLSSASYANQQILYPDNWLISPQYTVQEGDHASFWVKGQDPNYPSEHYAVFVSTTSNTDTTAFTKISEDLYSGSEYEFMSFDISAYAGQNIYFAIRHYNSSNMFRINIDDVTLGVPEYGEWHVISGITDNSYTITDLLPSTTYEVKVSTLCGDSEPKDFSTEHEGVNETENGINVWNRTGEIRIDIANDGNYTMNVVNILGQSVITSNVNGQGSHVVKHNLTSGVYVVTLSNNENSFSTKIVVR